MTGTVQPEVDVAPGGGCRCDAVGGGWSTLALAVLAAVAWRRR